MYIENRGPNFPLERKIGDENVGKKSQEKRYEYKKNGHTTGHSIHGSESRCAVSKSIDKATRVSVTDDK